MWAFDEYEKNFSIRLNSFLINLQDASELDFIIKEIDSVNSEIQVYEKYECLLIDEDSNGNYLPNPKRGKYYTNLKVLAFLKEKESEFKSIISVNVKSERKNVFKIKGNLDDETVLRYFSQLCNIHSDYPQAKKELICVLNESQIKELLFPTQPLQNKLVTTDFTQTQLRIFMYQFWRLHKCKGKNELNDFVKFTIENFQLFDGLLLRNEYSNFNKSNGRMNEIYSKFK